MSSGHLSISNRGRGPGLHGGRSVLIHSKKLCWSYPFKPETRRRAGGMKSPPKCLSHSFKSGWRRLGKPLISPKGDMPTNHNSHGTSHKVHSDYTSACVSLRPFPLEFHFLNEAIASTDSGESVFSTRALRVIKFSELIFKMKSNREQRKVCHPFPDEVSDSICMKHPSRIWETKPTFIYIKITLNILCISLLDTYCVICTY